MKILMTGSSGFIGSALIRHLIHETEHHVLNVDKLTYASNPDALASVDGNDRYQFVRVDTMSGVAFWLFVKSFGQMLS